MLTPKKAADALAKDRAARLSRAQKKLAAGKPITAAERALLAELAGESQATSSSSGYARTWEDLAEACSVDRRTLQNLRVTHAALIQQRKKRLSRADGRHCIAEWIQLLTEVGVEGRGVNNPESTLMDERALKIAKLQLEVDRGRWEFEVKKDKHLPVADFEAALSVTLTSFNAWLNAFVGRVNPRLEGLDFHARAVVLEEELEIGRRAIARCEYLEPAATNEFDFAPATTPMDTK